MNTPFVTMGRAFFGRRGRAPVSYTHLDVYKRQRLDKAAYLLRTSALTVGQVIELVGYDNTSYFHRAFRARFGLTPAAYRKQMRT